jgi:hypothetical protein
VQVLFHQNKQNFFYFLFFCKGWGTINQTIGLIQIDGRLPNLALMKLSAYHKQQGDTVILMKDKEPSQRLIPFDKVYISCIFEDNKDIAVKISKQFPNSEIGGIGINSSKLPDEIEHIKPDYDIFKCDYSVGFSSRGCFRNCPFCKVMGHEGFIRPNCDIYEFWDKRHKHIVLQDNNILALPQHFEKIAEQIKKENLSVDFNQGLDIRLINDNNAKILSELNVKPSLRFAFDSVEIEPQVIKGIEILEKYGIKRAMWYVLVGFNTTIKQDLYRLNLLKSLNQRAYVMRYKTCRGIQAYDDLASWSNQPQFFMSMDFETFIKCRRNRSEINTFKRSKSKC